MIHIAYIEPDNGWKTKADNETKKLIAMAKSGAPLVFKDKIWQKLKTFLKERFHDKCAYCEGNYSAGSSMAVEHYRPKGRVTDNPNSIHAVTDNSAEHPGYYWLAYEPTNLLLACEKCNQGAGKQSFFPIRGPRACNPEDSLEAEKPLLLNPYLDKNPAGHFAVSDLDGVIEGVTIEGKSTIEICDLNRESLRQARKRELENEIATLLVDMAIRLRSQSVDPSATTKKENKRISDHRPFSTYIRKGLTKFLEAEMRTID